MTLDTLDAAFVRRWQELPTRSPPPPATAPIPAALEPAAACPAQTVREAPRGREPTPFSVPDDSPLVERLLAEAAPQWEAIADRVEAARGRGCRVIAVAGHEHGEGRTTIVAALVRVLRSRGRDVVECDAATLPTDAGPTHDKRIVLVDAGVWFPPGPIRRPRLLVASYGCEAVIIVRRADRPVTPAIEPALAAIGIEVLGEVLTFANVASAAGMEP